MWASIKVRHSRGRHTYLLHRAHLLCLLVLGLLFPHFTAGLASGTIDVFTSKDGMINNQVNVIHEQNNGYLWIATAGGLVRFNGLEFEGFDNDPDRPKETVLTLESDSKGQLWILTERALYSFSDERFLLHYQAPDDRIRSHFIRSEKEIMLGVGSRVIFLEQGQDMVIHGQDQGLPANPVNTLMQDREGHIWAGFRFNGIARLEKGKNNWRTFGTEDGLPNATVLDFFQDSSGKVWAATLNGLAIIEGDRILPAPFNPELPYPIIQDILEDGNGHIWLRPSRGGVARWDGQRLWIYTQESGLPSERVFNFYLDLQDRLWFSTANGAGLYENGQFRVLNRDAGLSSDLIHTIHASREGLVWIGTAYGLNRYQDPTLETLIEDPQLEMVPGYSMARRIVRDRDDRLWFPSYKGLGLQSKNGFSLFTEEDGLPSLEVHLVTQDGEGRIWVGTTGGICYWTGERFVPVISEDTIRAHRLVADQDGGVWALDLDNRVWQASVPTEGEVSLSLHGTFKHANNLFRLSNGEVWLKTRDQLIQLHGELKKTVFLSGSNVADYIWTGEEWWFGSVQGLSRWSNGEMTTDPKLGLDQDQGVMDFWGGGPTGIWIQRSVPSARGFRSASTGVSRYKDGKFFHYHGGEELLDPDLDDVIPSEDGREVWLLHDRGLTTYYPEEERFVHFTVADGLSGNRPYDVLRDKQGHQWIASNGGLTKRHQNQLFVTKLSREDGLLNDEVSDIALDGEGTLWVRTLDGVQRFFGEKTGPIVKLTGWRDDDQPLPLTSGMELSSYQNNLTFHLGAIFLRRGADRVRFDYELSSKSYELSSKSTVATGETSEPRIHLPGLSSGNYRLRVTAFNPDFQASPEPVDFVFKIKAPIWLRPWFFISLLAVLGLMSYLIYRFRLRGKLEQARVLNELQTAQRMQMSLMPDAPPEQERLLLHGACQPAKEVGGDLFDYFWMDKHKRLIGLTVMDVSGKSMEAAIISVMNSGLVCGEQGSSRSPGEVLTKINRPLFYKTSRKTFTTALFGVIDLDSLVFSWANAGHSEPIIVRDGSLVPTEKPKRTDLPLGAVAHWAYQEQQVQLEPGDKVLVYTDGLDEAHNASHHIFGKARIEQYMCEHQPASPKETVDGLLAEIAHFRGDFEPHDDITMIVVNVEGQESTQPMTPSPSAVRVED